MRLRLIFALAIILLTLPAVAAGERTIFGGRAGGMGGTAVARSDLWSVRNNPAGLARVESASAGMAFDDRFMLPGLINQAIAAAIPLRNAVTGISASRCGGKYYNEMKAGLALARQFGNRFGAGVQFDYFRLSAGSDYGSWSAVSFGIGLMHQPGPDLLIGVHLVNPVPVKISGTAREYLPASITMGLSYNISGAFTCSVEAEKDAHTPPLFRAGAEYMLTHSVSARFGIQSGPASVSFGVGMKSGRMNFDFASGYHPVLGFSPAGSLIFSLSGGK